MTLKLPTSCEHCDAVLVIIDTDERVQVYPVVGDRDVVLRHAAFLVQDYSNDIEAVETAVLAFTTIPPAVYVLNDGEFEAHP